MSFSSGALHSESSEDLNPYVCLSWFLSIQVYICSPVCPPVRQLVCPSPQLVPISPAHTIIGLLTYTSISIRLSVCFISRVLHDSMTCYVGQSIGPLVRRSVRVSFFRRLRAFFALLLLPNCSNSLFYHCPCPPARDFGSRVYGLVTSKTCKI